MLLLLVASLSLQAQSWQYAKSFGGENGDIGYPNNQPHNMVSDENGNAYVFGTYGAGTQFNDSTLPLFVDGTRGGFITKFNCAGEVEWFKAISNSEQWNDQASYMILKGDYLFLSGSCHIDNFYKTWFLDTLVIGSILNQDYPDDCVFPWIPYHNYSYLIKMDLEGDIVDYHLFSLYNDNIAKTNAIMNLWNNPANQRGFAIDNIGNYYLLARLNLLQTSVIFCNNEPITDTIVPELLQKPFHLLKFDSDFNLLWQKPIISAINDPDNYGVDMEFFDMSCDSQNNLYMVGYLTTVNESGTEPNTVEIDLGNEQHLETYINEYSVGFLLKMNSDGEVQWTQQTKGYDYDGFGSSCTFESLLLDEATDNIYVTGLARQACTNLPNSSTIFGETDTLVAYFPNSNSLTGFIANYDLNGNYKWVRTPQARYCRIGSLDLYDDVLYSSLKWNVELLHNEQYFSYPIGTSGFNICTWDRDGNQVGTITVESTCSGLDKLRPFDTRVNSWGEIFITGTYDYGLTFGEHYIYGDGFKMFIAKYGNPCPIITDETSVFCYGSEYNGSVLTQSGDYQFILESSTPEVDSVVNLHATVYPQLTTGINDTTFCNDETYVLEANNGYNTYSWSTGSATNEQELTYNSTGIENVYVTLTDDNCTGIDTIVITIEVCGFAESQVTNNLNLYPVPANSHVTVQLSDNQKIEAYSVFNLQGKLIKSENISFESSFTITTQELPAGQYLIYVKTDEGVYSGGFVKE